MPPVAVTERLAAAQSEVEAACSLLTAPTPQALAACQQTLVRAVSQMAEVRAGCRAPSADPAIRRAVGKLRMEIRLARHLLESLATFYRGWERILGTMSGGYTADGCPAPVERSTRLVCRG